MPMGENGRFQLPPRAFSNARWQRNGEPFQRQRSRVTTYLYGDRRAFCSGINQAAHRSGFRRALNSPLKFRAYTP